MQLKRDPNKLNVYLEGRKRRAFVGALTFVPAEQLYRFEYDEKYFRSKRAIPLGPELNLAQKVHLSNKERLFPSLADRIPDRSNPAYAEYCASQGISVDERNPIILLGTIGRRGPSSFVFESVFISEDDILRELKTFRQELDLSINDLAQAFDVSRESIIRFESGKTKDKNLIKLLNIFLNYRDVSLWQLKMTGGRLHEEKLSRLIQYFEKQV